MLDVCAVEIFLEMCFITLVFVPVIVTKSDKNQDKQESLSF